MTDNVKFPCCVLLALSWNTNENPSTDNLSRATLGGQNTFRFPPVPSVLSLLLFFLTQKYSSFLVAVANALIKNSLPGSPEISTSLVSV